jgi:hypothetical protein
MVVVAGKILLKHICSVSWRHACCAIQTNELHFAWLLYTSDLYVPCSSTTKSKPLSINISPWLHAALVSVNGLPAQIWENLPSNKFIQSRSYYSLKFIFCVLGLKSQCKYEVLSLIQNDMVAWTDFSAKSWAFPLLDQIIPLSLPAETDLERWNPSPYGGTLRNMTHRINNRSCATVLLWLSATLCLTSIGLSVLFFLS